MYAPIDRLLISLGREHWRRAKPQKADIITLGRSRIFIFPTRYGLMFALLLLVMLIGSLNYNSELGLTFTFLLASVGLVSILHTYRNMAHLTLRAGKVMPVYVGEEAVFSVLADNQTKTARLAITLLHGKRMPVFVDVPAYGATEAPLSLPMTRRGLVPLEEFKILTTFPLGLFRAWSYVNLGMSCLVYPRPGPRRAAPKPHSREQELGDQGRGVDDFAGLRGYHPSDSPRHVHWKAAARGQGLHTKQFGGESPSELWLDWEALRELDKEERLSQLCRMVLDAHAAGCRFGLRLPGVMLEPGIGEAHKHACLKQLALF